MAIRKVISPYYQFVKKMVIRLIIRGQRISGAYSNDVFTIYRDYVLNQIKSHSVGKSPFYHMFIDEILPQKLYDEIFQLMVNQKYGGNLQERIQDNKEFVNKRFGLSDTTNVAVVYLKNIFLDHQVKLALFKKFYIIPSNEFISLIDIHEKEFEFVFCSPHRFQNIHVDIPPKYMSLVFYFPEAELTEEQEKDNATILYDKNLEPNLKANFRRNSVCVFSPHFYSYHGFSSTMQRDVIVMFYLNKNEKSTWNKDIANDESFKQATYKKLITYPLIEYGKDYEKIQLEMKNCLVNRPMGRVVKNDQES